MIELSSSPAVWEVGGLVSCDVTCIHRFLLVWVQLNNRFLFRTQPPVFACIVLCSLLDSLIRMEHSLVSYYMCHKCVKWIFISQSTLKVSEEHVICKALSSLKNWLPLECQWWHVEGKV